MANYSAHSNSEEDIMQRGERRIQRQMIKRQAMLQANEYSDVTISICYIIQSKLHDQQLMKAFQPQRATRQRYSLILTVNQQFIFWLLFNPGLVEIDMIIFEITKLQEKNIHILFGMLISKQFYMLLITSIAIVYSKPSFYDFFSYVLNIDLRYQDNNQMYQQSKEKLLPTKQQTKSSRMGKWKIFFSLLMTFQRNYQTVLLEINPEKAINDSYVVSKVPGYRKYQLIFLYYLRKYGICKSFLISLAFPLPFTILFYALSGYLQHLEIKNQLEIVLIGLRCSVISYLCRYCLHFPEERLNWIIYIVSIICAIISNNNYIFVIIYFLGIFMSYFKSQDIRTRSSLVRDSKEQRQLQQEIIKLDVPHIERKQLYVVALIIFFLVCWIVQRMHVHSNNHYYLIEIFIISLLNTNQEISSFYPGLYSHLTHNTNIYTANLYSLGYLLPGLHLKTFFLLFHSEDLPFLVFSYFAIHLPSLLVLCISLGYKSIFFSLGWKKINLSIQAVSNGLVLVTVINLLNEQTCHWNIAFFTSLVIFTVTKLYKFNEIISACLGIFLVASRASVLHFTNKKSLPDFLCKPQ